MARGIADIPNSGGRSESERQKDYNYIDKHYTTSQLKKEVESREAAKERFNRKPYYLTGGVK